MERVINVSATGNQRERVITWSSIASIRGQVGLSYIGNFTVYHVDCMTLHDTFRYLCQQHSMCTQCVKSAREVHCAMSLSPISWV